MDLRQLEYFVNVVEYGSFSQAAVALNLGQPSLSRQVGLLEQELGQRLLVRTGRGVLATEAGSALLAHARLMLETARRASEEVRDMGISPSGRVVVGMPPRVALGLCVPLFKQFRVRFPRAVLTVLEGLSLALRESLIAGRLDMALLFDPLPSNLLLYTELVKERLYLVAPRGKKLPERVGPASLATYPMILPSAPNAIRSLVDTAVRPKHIELQVVAEVGAVNTALALVADGQGFTILPESAIDLDRNGVGLPRTPIGPPTIWNRLHLAVRVARPDTRLTRETAQMLRDLDFRGGGGG